jgi:hypothetical protein
MSHTTVFPTPVRRSFPWWPFIGSLFLLVLGVWLTQQLLPEPLLASGGPPDFPYEVTTSDLNVEWSQAGSGDFDPKDKCPEDFFRAGFVVLCRKKPGGQSFKFLYHRGKRLLYRIDRDVLGGKAYIGLHWVESTLFGTRYRIADKGFAKGRALSIPTGKKTPETRTFHYGQAVSKRRSRPERELFSATHIQPGQCDSWWDIFTFNP